LDFDEGEDWLFLRFFSEGGVGLPFPLQAMRAFS
jgi:hypothetical protein